MRSSGSPRRRPQVVLSDIEMPRMDGFDLVRNIRGDARWRDLPVIMITSRIAAEAPRPRRASSASTTTSASPTRKRNCWR